MPFDPISFVLAKSKVSLEDVKNMLRNEGVENKKYDSNIDGVFDETSIPHTLANVLTVNNDLIANRIKLLNNLILDSEETTRIQFDTSNNKVIIPSSLTVQGDLTYVSSTNLQVEDNVITLNAGESGDGVSLGSAGIEIDRGTLSNAQILFDDVNDKFIFRLADGTYMPVDIGSLSIGGTTVIDSNRDLVGLRYIRQNLTLSFESSSLIDIYLEESDTGKKWVISHRGSAYSTSPSRLLFTYFDGTNWHPAFKIDPGTVDYIELAGNVNIKVGELRIEGTTVIDNSRNLKNINSLSFVKNSGVSQIILEALDADDTNTLRSSPFISLRAKYWDGSSSVIRNLILFNRMVSADTYEFVIRDYSQLIDLLQVKSNGDVNIPSGGLMIGGTQVIDSNRNLVGINSVLQNLIIDRSGTSDSCRLIMNAPSGYNAIIIFKDAGATRWSIYKDGANNFRIGRYDATGTLIDKPIEIDVDTGDVNIANSLKIGGTTVIDSSRNLVGINQVKQDLTLDKGSGYPIIALNNYGTATWRGLIKAVDTTEDWEYYIIFKASTSGTVGSDRMISFEFKDPSGTYYIPLQMKPTIIQANKTMNIVGGDLQIGGTTVIDSSRNVKNVQLVSVSKSSGYAFVDMERSDIPQLWSLRIGDNGNFFIYDFTNAKTMLSIKPNTGDINIVNGDLIFEKANAEIKAKQGFAIHLDKDAEGTFAFEIKRNDGTTVASIDENGHIDAHMFKIYGTTVIDNSRNLTNIANANVGSLSIGGTQVIDSGRNLQNVSIDRSTTNLTPALIFHTTSVQSVASGRSQTPVTITTKYIYTNLGIDYKQIRLIAYGMCGNGFGWRLYVVDDGGATICVIWGTATSYERKDSGWVTLPSTEYIELKLQGKYNADAGIYDSAYAKNIALFVR